MKITVICGNAAIGSEVVAALTDRGHVAVAASRETGVDPYTGEGLAEALSGASAVVDVTDHPAQVAALVDYLTTSTRNILDAEETAGVAHHLALSVVGTMWLPQSDFFHAKHLQEELIGNGRVPYSIVRATQLFEFTEMIARAATDGGTICVAPALVQPMAAADAATALARLAVGPPLGRVVEVAGPEQFRLDVFIRRWLDARGDPRRVIADQTAPFFGAVLDEHDLLPEFSATCGPTRFGAWLDRFATTPTPDAVLAARA